MGENNKPNILNQVNQIDEELKNLEKKKETIQESCDHLETYISFNEKNKMRLYCNTCKKDLGWPTQAQHDAFLDIKKENGNKGSTG